MLFLFKWKTTQKNVASNQFSFFRHHFFCKTNVRFNFEPHQKHWKHFQNMFKTHPQHTENTLSKCIESWLVWLLPNIENIFNTHKQTYYQYFKLKKGAKPFQTFFKTFTHHFFFSRCDLPGVFPLFLLCASAWDPEHCFLGLPLCVPVVSFLVCYRGLPKLRLLLSIPNLRGAPPSLPPSRCVSQEYIYIL